MIGKQPACATAAGLATIAMAAIKVDAATAMRASRLDPLRLGRVDVYQRRRGLHRITNKNQRSIDARKVKLGKGLTRPPFLPHRKAGLRHSGLGQIRSRALPLERDHPQRRHVLIRDIDLHDHDRLASHSAKRFSTCAR